MPVGKVFSGSVEGALVWSPFIADPPNIQSSGISIGTSIRTRSGNRLDILHGIASGLLPEGGEFLFAGNRGFGKTVGMKNIGTAQLTLKAIDKDGQSEPMRVFIDNRKVAGQNVGETVAGEWGGLITALGCKTLKIRQMRLEIFDPIMSDTDQLTLAIDVAEFINGGPLTVYQKLALRIIQYTVIEKYQKLLSSPTIEKIGRTIAPSDFSAFDAHMDELLLERFADDVSFSQEDKERLYELCERPETADREKVLRACGEISDIFKLLLDGEFGYTFAGKKPLSSYLRETALMFDFEDLNDREVALFEIVRFRIMTAAVKKGDHSVIPHLLIREEVQELDSQVVLLRAWAYWTATQRSRHTITFSSTQYLTTFHSSTRETESAKYWQMIYNGINCLVLFNQPVTDEIRELLIKRDMSPEDIDLTSALPVGVALIKFAGHPTFTNQFHVTPVVKKLIASRGAAERMAFNRTPVREDPRVKARIIDVSGKDLR